LSVILPLPSKASTSRVQEAGLPGMNKALVHAVLPGHLSCADLAT